MDEWSDPALQIAIALIVILLVAAILTARGLL